MTIVVASTYRQAVLAAEQLELKHWKWAHRARDVRGYAKGADIVHALPALGVYDHDYWECLRELQLSGIEPKEIWT
jgi:hypothetical protein